MFYWLVKTVSQLIFKLLFRAEVIGAENLPSQGAVILAANHMSNFDPPFLGCFMSRPVCYMAKTELFKNPIFGAAIRACHAFPVKRGAADRGAIKAALTALEAGKCLGLFPEGTRSRTGEIKKAEAGLGLIAAMSKAAVVPAAIIGTHKIFSTDEKFPRLKLICGKPMFFEGDRKDKEALAKFSQAVMDEIGKMKQEHEKQ